MGFSIENEDQKYRIFVDGYSGDAGNSFKYHNNMMFSTFDSDNDESSGECAAARESVGWWYKSCDHVLLTGPYRYAGETFADWKGIIWNEYTGKDKSLKFAEMKVRR